MEVKKQENTENIQNKSLKKKSWQKQGFCPSLKSEIKNHFLELNDFIAQILAGKFSSLTEIESFISPYLKNNMKDPTILKDLDKASNHIIDAIKNKKKIAIFGDYDVDGATSSALIINYLKSLDIDVTSYIPDRQKEGYGPNKNAFLFLKQEKQIDLVITVDCGASSIQQIKYANEIGLEVIIIDHHLATGKKPEAIAVINPNHIDEQGEYKYLAAVGVCFLLLVIINKKIKSDVFFKEKTSPDLLDLLDIVALGTVCDVVPLIELNRAFVSAGIKVMKKKPRLGIKALADVANLDFEKLSAYHFGFIIGPRINAGGRVGESYLGTKLLTTNNKQEAYDIALKLEKYNKERKTIENLTLDIAISQVENKKLANKSVIIIAEKNLHIGVIGIVASRIKEKYNKPTIIISFDQENLGKASARSIKNVDLGDAIIKAKENNLLIAGGGHKMAAGFSILAEKLTDFEEFLQNHLKNYVTKSVAEQKITYQSILSISALKNIELYHSLTIFEPYGMANSEPRFVINNCKVVFFKLMAEKHLKLIISEQAGGIYNKDSLEAIIWNAHNNDLYSYIESNYKKRTFSFLGKIRINEWQGVIKTQFEIEDVMML